VVEEEHRTLGKKRGANYRESTKLSWRKQSEEVSEDSMCGALNLSLVQDSHLPFSLPPKGSCPNFLMTNVEEISTR